MTKNKTIRTFTEYDLELLGYTPVVNVGPESDVFRVYRATATAGVKSIDHHFVYIKDEGINPDGIQRAIAAAKRLTDVHFVIPDKSTLSEKGKADLQRIGPIYAHSSLIWARLQSVFAEFLKSIQEEVPDETWFIQPRYADSQSDPKAQLDRDVIAYLSHDERKPTPFESGNLLVVKAPAGVGKTTLARHVVRELARDAAERRVIPVFVEASHWGKLQLQSIRDIWDIIRNSLNSFSTQLSLRRELFEYALRQGWLSFVFDGFDELCARRQSNFNANEVLTDLAKLTEQSDASVLLTTRSLFWDAEVSSVPDNVQVCALAPFNKAQASAYFQARFSKNKDLATKASALYSAVIAHTHTPETPGGSRAQLINTPICVSMVADLAEQGEDAVAAGSASQLLYRLLIKLCERDKKRQQFSTPPDLQLAALQNLAAEDEVEFSDIDLQVLGFSGDDITAGRTIDHALLTSGSVKQYKLRYDFLNPYFKAVHISENLFEPSDNYPRTVLKLITQEANGRGFVLEHLVHILPENALDSVAKRAQSTLPLEKDLRSFLFHLLRLLLDEERPKDSPTERAAFLLTAGLGAIPKGKKLSIENRQISGPLERLDLRNVTFVKCQFRDVSFSRCLVGDSTEFALCEFSGDFGVPDKDTSQWKSVQLTNCQTAPPASLVIADLLSADQADPASVAREVIRLALEKFWHHGQLKRSIRFADWNRGLLATTRLAKSVLDALVKAGVVEQITISGVKEGGLGIPMEAVPDIKQLMDNNQIVGLVKRAYDEIVERLR